MPYTHKLGRNKESQFKLSDLIGLSKNSLLIDKQDIAFFFPFRASRKARYG